MLIRLLCVHEMIKHVCKISHLNSKQLLRKLQKMLGGLLYFAAPCSYYGCELWDLNVRKIEEFFV